MNIKSVKTYLSALIKAGETMNFRVFDDKKSTGFKGAKLAAKEAELDDILPVLENHNRLGRGVFLVINAGGNTDKEITSIRAQFVEMDEGTFEEQKKKIQAFPIRPSLVVQTRKSYHIYWLVKGAEVGRFREIQQGLVKAFGGDPACVNESRVMRVPGFDHCKAEPVEVKLVHCKPERIYTQQQLAEVLPKPEKKEASAQTAADVEDKPPAIKVRAMCSFIKYCGDNSKTLPEPLWFAMIANLAPLKDGAALIHELSKDYPKYSYEETETRIARACSGKARPVTCKKITELGYKCPKFEAGGCGVKSPAGLAYKKQKPKTEPWYEGNKFLPGVLAQELARVEKIISCNQIFYKYADGVYAELPDTLLEKLIKSRMDPRLTRYAQVADCTKLLGIEVSKTEEELKTAPYIINIRNGLYDVKEDKLLPHTPDFLSRIQLAVKYDKAADCPRFRQFLSEAMDGDEDQVKLIQEILGYLLVPVTSAQKCFILMGAESAGKSVLLRVIEEILLGKKHVSAVAWQALNERFKTAELYGKLANIFADLPTSNIEDAGIFKALVGEDYLTAERKHQHPFSFQSTARLLFSCNNLPKNYNDRSGGFYRRLLIIRFNKTVPPERRDPDLIKKFETEKDGIFMFALEGLRRLIANNYCFSETEANREEVARYKRESDSALSFVYDRCKADAAAVTGSTELYEAYKHYCEENGLHPYARNKFTPIVQAAVPGVTAGKDSVGKRRVLKGIKLLRVDG